MVAVPISPSDVPHSEEIFFPNISKTLQLTRYAEAMALIRGVCLAHRRCTGTDVSHSMRDADANAVVNYRRHFSDSQAEMAYTRLYTKYHGWYGNRSEVIDPHTFFSPHFQWVTTAMLNEIAAEQMVVQAPREDYSIPANFTTF